MLKYNKYNKKEAYNGKLTITWIAKPLVYYFDEENTTRKESLRDGSGENEAIFELTEQWDGWNNSKSVEGCKISLKLVQSRQESSNET